MVRNAPGGIAQDAVALVDTRRDFTLPPALSDDAMKGYHRERLKHF